MDRLSHKVILVHKGALGDFLQTWPSIYSIVTSSQVSTVLWAGREEHFFWLRPLPVEMLGWRERMLVDRLYCCEEPPLQLQGSSLVWFGLNLPPNERPVPGLFFLKGIGEEREVVWHRYLRQLPRLGILPAGDWRDAWQRFFPIVSKEIVAIFPGSGHPLKNWSLKRFEEVARRLEKMGERVVFVLGPVEVERGLVPSSRWERVVSSHMKGLFSLLQKTKLCIGNDSGPLHLAGFMGIPSVCIFGPTDPLRWGPVGARIVKTPRSCAPCTPLIDIKCTQRLCLEDIGVESVWKEVEGLLF